MKEAVAGELAAAYHSALVDEVRAGDFRHEKGRLTVHLAREFGFCYGVDRAVDYAYQARRAVSRTATSSSPARSSTTRTSTTGCAPPASGSSAIPGERGRHARARRRRHPAGLRRHRRRHGAASRAQGCTLVDTTCGSVLNVWKNVVRYAQDGFTAIIHGKVKHEETRATASQALKYPRRALPRRARSRRGRRSSATTSGSGGDREAFLARFGERGRRPASIPTPTSRASAAPTRRRC